MKRLFLISLLTLAACAPNPKNPVTGPNGPTCFLGNLPTPNVYNLANGNTLSLTNSTAFSQSGTFSLVVPACGTFTGTWVATPIQSNTGNVTLTYSPAMNCGSGNINGENDSYSYQAWSCAISSFQLITNSTF